MSSSPSNADSVSDLTPDSVMESTPSGMTTLPSTQQQQQQNVSEHESFLPPSNSAAGPTAPTTTTRRGIRNSTTTSVLVDEPPSSSPYPTLHRSPTTPWIAGILLPFLCGICHVIFYYGQTEPMWKLHVNATIDVWANATETTAKAAFSSLGIDYENHLTFQEEEDVQTFTYMFAIQELWRAKGLPGLLLPRLAAVLLIVFSGLWPHLKLIMLNITWFLGRHPTRRTRTLQWLSGLGKWSLADVLVVCVMVGVLHLDWIVEPDDIKQGVITDLPSILAVVESLYDKQQLCDKLLKMECSSQRNVIKKTKCEACQLFVDGAYNHPGWAQSTGRTILDGVQTSGGGVATLRVVGMRGIYAFCGAVILSILLSLAVDIFDVRAKARLRRQQRAERRLRTLSASANALAPSYSPFDNNNDDLGDTNDNTFNEPLLNPSNRGRTGSLEIELPGEQNGDGNRSEGPIPRSFTFRFLILSLFTTLVVVFAVDSFSMERLVTGAGPQLLHEVLGMNWEKLYSLRSLMWTTGASGGWDYMLMGTFGLFCVLGPVIRGVLLVATVILDQCRCSSAVPYLSHAVNFIGSFCAWEVFAIAIIMVQMLMPSITDTIVQNPACGKVSEDGSCLQVEFNVIPFTFLIVLAGGVLLVGMSWVTTSTISKDTALRNYGGGIGDSGSVTSFGSSGGTGGRLSASGSRMIQPNHNYHRLQGIQEEEQQYNPGAEDGMEELIFETNNV